MMMRLTDVIHNAAEQIGDISRSMLPWVVSPLGIRGWFGGVKLGLRFWPTTHPAMEGSEVNYDVTRSLYRNDGDMALGSAFAKPIVDLQVAFIGIPHVSTPNEAETQFLNECINSYWLDEIQQMLRDSIRDGKVIVRVSKPDVFDPLMTLDEARHGTLEIIPPELVDIERNSRNRNIIERAVVHHKIQFVMDEGDVANGRDPITEEHDVIEIIDRERVRFFDQTTNEWLTGMESRNSWGFVNLLEVYNEWDSSLQGGQSDLETVVPFIRAFHNVITQGLQAHSYHSTPKVVMKLIDVAPFIKNNFPEAIDEQTGEVKAQSEINYRGREIMIIQTGEEISFLEAESILGDTKILAEFLIDCICIASQTPEWAFMRVDSGSANSDRNAQTVPFVKKIDRKRRGATKAIQNLMKMILVMNGLIPVRGAVTWNEIRADDEVVHMQAFQQLVMGLEIARQRGEISDETYQNMIRRFLPAMGSNKSERSLPEQPEQSALPPAEPSIRSGS